MVGNPDSAATGQQRSWALPLFWPSVDKPGPSQNKGTVFFFFVGSGFLC